MKGDKEYSDVFRTFSKANCQRPSGAGKFQNDVYAVMKTLEHNFHPQSDVVLTKRFVHTLYSARTCSPDDPLQLIQPNIHLCNNA